MPISRLPALSQLLTALNRSGNAVPTLVNVVLQCLQSHRPQHVHRQMWVDPLPLSLYGLHSFQPLRLTSIWNPSGAAQLLEGLNAPQLSQLSRSTMFNREAIDRFTKYSPLFFMALIDLRLTTPL